MTEWEKKFDFNGDGELDSLEKAAMFEAYNLLNEFAEDNKKADETGEEEKDDTGDGNNEFDVFGSFDEYGAADEGPGFTAADSVDTDGLFGFDHEFNDGEDYEADDEDDEFDIF